jgi:hypothetical protein
MRYPLSSSRQTLPDARIRGVFNAIVLLAALVSTADAQAARPVLDTVVVEATITDLQRGMSEGRFTSLDLTRAYLARIAAYDQKGPALNAMIRLNPAAEREATAMDVERRAGKVRGPLHGIPVVLKDNYNTADMPTTGSTLALASFVPREDAFIKGRPASPGDHRQVQPARTRRRHNECEFPGRADAQSLRSSSLPRWFERRHWCGDRRVVRGGRMGKRHVRIDPHPGRVRVAVWPSSVERPGQPERRHSSLAHAGRDRPARAHGDRPGHRSTSRSDGIPRTRRQVLSGRPLPDS